MKKLILYSLNLTELGKNARKMLLVIQDDKEVEIINNKCHNDDDNKITLVYPRNWFFV